MARRLIVNADDFGFTRDVNLGIVEAHRRGILTAATLMVNGMAFEHAVELARENPGLDVGCHLVLVGGRSVADPARKLPGSVRRLGFEMGAWVEREMEAQVEKILAVGLRPSHVDTHKHTHLAPPVLGAVCRIAHRYGIPWVRRPFDLPLMAVAPLRRRVVNAALQPIRAPFDRTLRRYGCRTTDYFAGFQITGRFRAGELAELIRALPDGLTEFMCHPGHCTEELRSSATRLKESRAEELAALVSEEVRRAVEEAGVRLVNFREAAPDHTG
jgi:hopanoid biosynthesis associated protein HpnK